MSSPLPEMLIPDFVPDEFVERYGTSPARTTGHRERHGGPGLSLAGCLALMVGLLVVAVVATRIRSSRPLG